MTEDYPLTVEERDEEDKKFRNRQASAISGGIFMIGLGVMFFTGWWWPGMMFVIGLSGGASLLYRGRIWEGLNTIAFFFGLPGVVWLVDYYDISWGIAGPILLIGLGLFIMANVQTVVP